MKHARHQRIISLQSNKQNQLFQNKENQSTNFPSLRHNNKKLNHSNNFQNEYHLNLNINLNQRKKTYLNLYTKKDNLKYQTGRDGREGKDGFGDHKNADTTRLMSDQTLTTQMSGVYLSSRAEKSINKGYKGSTSEKYQGLQRHEINIKMRAKMIDWLLQIVEAYRCKDQTFFLALHLMDKYFLVSPRNLQINQLHQIGVTCIYMACKYEQIHQIRMKTMVRDISHSKISAKQIITRQYEILEALDYKYERKCLYLTSQEILCKFRLLQKDQIQKNCKNTVNEDCFQTIKDFVCYFAKLLAFDFDLLRKTDCQILAKGTILASIRSLPENMKQLEVYDSFIASCGKDYQKCHQICSQIIFLNINFKSQFGNQQNIHKLNPLHKKKINTK